MAALAAAPQITAPAGALSDGDRSFLQDAMNQPPRLEAGTIRFLQNPEYSNQNDWGTYHREELPSSPRGVREPPVLNRATISQINDVIRTRWQSIQTELQENQDLLTQNRQSSFLKLYKASLRTLYSDPANATQADYDRASKTARLATLERQAAHLQETAALANRRLDPNSSSCIIL